MIVLPGLVETHWHMWNTLFRSFAGEKADQGYFPTAAALGAVMMPEDMYHGTRLGAAEALSSGITTVHATVTTCEAVRMQKRIFVRYRRRDSGALVLRLVSRVPGHSNCKPGRSRSHTSGLELVFQ